MKEKPRLNYGALPPISKQISGLNSNSLASKVGIKTLERPTTARLADNGGVEADTPQSSINPPEKRVRIGATESSATAHVLPGKLTNLW